MKIHAYIITWNEEKVIPWTLCHYKEFCEKITLLDNMSDDKTLDYAKQFGADVISFNTGGQFNDYANSQMKSECYKISRDQADWVIVCDADELLYTTSSKVFEYYSKIGCLVPRVVGYDMVSKNGMPNYEKQSKYSDITEIIDKGVQHDAISKRVIFKPELDVHFGLGAHSSRFYLNGKEVNSEPQFEQSYSNLKLLHYKHVGVDYVRNRMKQLEGRIPPEFKKGGIAAHVDSELYGKTYFKTLIEYEPYATAVI